ncbi:MAG: CocE/NonD family hydrolase [Bacteroidota bacterium]|nr:CocE/NonD family hydrolase [Bacteroidota bacterium]
MKIKKTSCLVSRIPLLSLILLFVFASVQGFSQAIPDNGKFDDISELTTRYTIPFIMPDSTALMTDVFLPIVRDNFIVEVDLDGPGGFPPQPVELIKKGTQLLIYDSINGQPNPNIYQLPLIFSRTPYNKGDQTEQGGLLGLLGYGFAMQDLRGRYTSKGVYLPLYSDGWNKDPYHPNYKHILDVTPLSDPKNGNKHEDGYNSVQFILNNLKKEFDLNGDGIVDTVDNMFNGRIGTFGASALGYNQYQAAAAHKIDPTLPGLKCLLPIVGPAEFFKSTGFHNGVFRDRLVTGWLKGQIFTGTDAYNEFQDSTQVANDNDIQNEIHSAADYGMPNKFVAANNTIDHFSAYRYYDLSGNLGVAGYYPNSAGRKDMDASRAMVNQYGEGDANGTTSRYTNMEVPIYNLTGWWDIFIDGQIESRNYVEKYVSNTYGNKNLQKIVIGPWAHGTIGSRETGDMKGANKYPANVTDGIGAELSGDSALSISKLLKSDFVTWYRYNLNYNTSQYIGDPKFMIPESHKWQALAGGLAYIRAPSKNFKMTFYQFLNYMNGSDSLRNLEFQYVIGSDTINGNIVTDTISVPPTGQSQLSGLDPGHIDPIPAKNYATAPNVKFYVVGPVNDGVSENSTVGNYWFSANTFPITTDISKQKMYLHNNGGLDFSAPSADEGFKIYVHDPDNPVLTAGGGNMLEQIPNSNEDTEGQVDVASLPYAAYTMNRPGVVGFTSDLIQDSLSIIGFPVATLYAKSNPSGASSGLTDTDFMVRILDVYPDGRELFVVEGAVNARARLYAKNIVENPGMDEDYPFANDLTPFTNINVNEVYEYKFKCFPIGYTFGKNHKIKILISSSNFTRFQVNPNIPIAEGEFFRRKPGDGQGTNKTPDGTFMMPRVAVQRIAFSSQYPTNIELPVYQGTILSAEQNNHNTAMDILVYPNPASDAVTIYLSKNGEYKATLFDITGKRMLQSKSFNEMIKINVEEIPAGLYFVEVIDNKTSEKITNKLIITK